MPFSGLSPLKQQGFLPFRGCFLPSDIQIYSLIQIVLKKICQVGSSLVDQGRYSPQVLPFILNPLGRGVYSGIFECIQLFRDLIYISRQILMCVFVYSISQNLHIFFLSRQVKLHLNILPLPAFKLYRIDMTSTFFQKVY